MPAWAHASSASPPGAPDTPTAPTRLPAAAIGNLYSWRATFWLIALLGVGAAIVLWFLIPKTTTTDDDTGSTGGTEYKSKGDEGTISGTVAYAGPAPEAPVPRAKF